MVKIPARWFVELATVRTYLGESSTGKLYSEPVELRGDVDLRRRVVVNAEGDEVVSDLMFRTFAKHADVLTEGSLIATSDREVSVVAVKIYTDRGRPVYLEASTGR